MNPGEGYRMVSLNLKVLAKFGLCSDCSQKLDDSHARARKIFATAYGKTYWKNARAMNVSGNMFHPRLLTFY